MLSYWESQLRQVASVFKPSPIIPVNIISETKTSTELKNDKTETSTTKKEVHESVNVYNELVQLEQQALIANTETFECGVCLEECAPGNGVILRECVHSFCRECLTDIVRHSEEPDVSCPAVACRSLLQEREIRTLVSSEDYEKWLARGLAAAENGTRNSFHCRTRDCTGWALCEPGVRHFPCPVCKKINCVPCQVRSIMKCSAQNFVIHILYCVNLTRNHSSAKKNRLNELVNFYIFAEYSWRRDMRTTSSQAGVYIECQSWPHRRQYKSFTFKFNKERRSFGMSGMQGYYYEEMGMRLGQVFSMQNRNMLGNSRPTVGPGGAWRHKRRLPLWRWWEKMPSIMWILSLNVDHNSLSDY